MIILVEKKRMREMTTISGSQMADILDRPIKKVRELYISDGLQAPRVTFRNVSGFRVEFDRFPTLGRWIKSLSCPAFTITLTHSDLKEVKSSLDPNNFPESGRVFLSIGLRNQTSIYIDFSF
jgi:hypothetical protein